MNNTIIINEILSLLKDLEIDYRKLQFIISTIEKVKYKLNQIKEKDDKTEIQKIWSSYSINPETHEITYHKKDITQMTNEEDSLVSPKFKESFNVKMLNEFNKVCGYPCDDCNTCTFKNKSLFREYCLIDFIKEKLNFSNNYKEN
jgi:hypothetical protein